MRVAATAAAADKIRVGTRAAAQNASVANKDVVRMTLVVATTLAGLWVLYRIRHVLLLVGVAAFLALALEPAVTFLQRFLRSRALAVLVITVLVLAFATVFVASIVPPIAREVNNLVENLPKLREDLEDATTPIGALERRFDLTTRLQSLIGNASSFLSNFGRFFGTVAGFVADFLVVAVLSLYFLLHAPTMKREGIRLVPEPKRGPTAEVAEVVFAKVGGWMEGNILISVIAGIVSFLALAAFGVPYPAALAMWVAIADLIPMVGAILGAVVCVTVAFFTGAGPGIATLVFFLVYQQVENYLIGPRVMKRTVDVSPAAVIVAALVGGTLLGPVGMLLAVPAAASIKVLLGEFWPARRPASAPSSSP